MAKRDFYRQGRRERAESAKKLQRKPFAKLCVPRDLGGDKALSQQKLASACGESEKPYRKGAENAKRTSVVPLRLCGKAMRFATATSYRP